MPEDDGRGSEPSRRSDWLWWVGVGLLGLALLGPGLWRRLPEELGVVRDSLQPLLAAAGLALISVYFGSTARQFHREGGKWSLSVVGNAIGAVLTGLAFLALVVAVFFLR